MTIKVGIIGASFAKAAYLPAFKHIEEVISYFMNQISKKILTNES